MPDTWNQPTGPPNGAPISPSEAKREIEAAVAAARAEDEALRGRAVAVAHDVVAARARLAAATTEATDARALAKRALGKADESKRAGQRADAAKWAGAARVFAMRLRDARAEVAAAQAAEATAGRARDALEDAVGENVGRLQAVAAARLPALGGRKAARSQALVDDAVAALSHPLADVLDRAEAQARADLVAAGEAGIVPDIAPVTDDDLEREVDEAGTDEILDELRDELGIARVEPAVADDSATNDQSASEAADSDGAPVSEEPSADEAPTTDRSGTNGTHDTAETAASRQPHASGARA